MATGYPLFSCNKPSKAQLQSESEKHKDPRNQDPEEGFRSEEGNIFEKSEKGNNRKNLNFQACND